MATMRAGSRILAGIGRRRTPRLAVTLIELMIAIALTLIVVLAVVRVFDLLGGNVTKSRSILELSSRTRNISAQLQTDLRQLTVKVDPPADPLAGPGYFEIVEGIRSDCDNDGDGIPNQRVNPLDSTTWPKPFVVHPTFEQPSDPSVTPDVVLNQPFLNELAGTMGDTDDLWMGTVRSTAEPFRGRYRNPVTKQVEMIESPLAEVAWWLEPSPGPPGSPPGATGFTLVRRVLLIRPGLVLPLVTNEVDFFKFLAENDISVRIGQVVSGGRTLVANSLADLTVRKNRFAHWPTGAVANFSTLDPIVGPDNASIAAAGLTDLNWFPHTVNRRYLVRAVDNFQLAPQPAIDAAGVRNSLARVSDGSDTMLSEVVAFDLRVFDPLAALLPSTGGAGAGGYALTPVDAGYYVRVQDPNIAPFDLAYGAYVDLGYLMGPVANRIPLAATVRETYRSQFSHLPERLSQVLRPPGTAIGTVNLAAPRVYCTWSTSYDRDGVNQDGILGADQGTNGVNDAITPALNPGDTAVVVPWQLPDDRQERETLPPYGAPLRGVEVILRARDISSQEVRQSSVVADFVTH